MRLVKAQIVDNTDPLEQGRLLVYSKHVTDEYFWVTYVSPYSAMHLGGMVTIPEIGVEILITQPDGDSEWFYLGSVFGPREGVDNSGKEFLDAKNQSVSDQEVYRARGKPQRLLISDPIGNKLVLSSSYSKEYYNMKAALESSLGKVLELNDSPKIDAIWLRNEHGDGVKITSSPQESSAGRSVEIETQGPQKLISRESEIELMVIEGREIDITNESTGANKDDSLPKRFGNINIRSKKNDINLTVDDTEGKVFIDALGSNGIIQLDSTGKITIFAEQEVEIRAGSNLNLKAEGNLSLEAGAAINIKAGANLNLGAGSQASLKASGNVAVDGSQIHMNSGLSQEAESIDVGKEDNNYDD